MQTYYAIPHNTHTVTGMTGIGAYIRAQRTKGGMSQRQLAELSGMDRSYLAQIEGGRIALPGADIRRRLARALGVSHLDLLIAAGELTPEEVPIGTPVVERDPETAALIDWVSAIRWTPDRISWVRTVLSGMAEMS